jgi:hypothetical protein
MAPAPSSSAAIVTLAFALSLAAQEPVYKFSTTVNGEPLYTFGTTVVATTGFRGEIYFIKPGSRKLPDFSKLKPVGVIYTPYLCVPPRSFDQGFPGVTDRFEWFAIDYTARFWISEPGTYRFRLASDDGSILYIDGKTDHPERPTASRHRKGRLSQPEDGRARDSRLVLPGSPISSRPGSSRVAPGRSGASSVPYRRLQAIHRF